MKKTHKLKYYDTESFTTFCGLTDWNVEDEDLIKNRLVGENDDCSCKKCNKYYEINSKRNTSKE